MQEIAGSDFTLKADLVLLAMGFLGPRKAGHGGAVRRRARCARQRRGQRVGLQDLDPRLFAAGDMRRGQSLVVWAIREGRQCARAIDEFLMGTTTLPG